MAEICTIESALQVDDHETAMAQAATAVDAADIPNEPANKLNYLIDLVGELVIARASASLLAHRSGQSVMAEANSVVPTW